MSNPSIFRIEQFSDGESFHAVITEENIFFFDKVDFGLTYAAHFFNHYFRLDLLSSEDCFPAPDFTAEERIWWKPHKKNLRFYTKSPLPNHLTEHILMMNGKVTKREVLIKGLNVEGMRFVDLYPPESRCVPSATGAD